jgi:hypothetical protein
MKTALADQGGGEFSESPLQLKLSLAYEDEPTAERVKRAVNRVLNQPEVNVQLQFRVWKLDELADPERRERVVHEAADDDVLVVSMHGENRLTPEADATLNEWVRLKRTKPCALVISLDPEAKPLAETNSSLEELRTVAVRNGLTVMLQFEEPECSDMETVIADIRRRANTLPHVFDELVFHTDQYRHWGLNE